MEQKTRQPLSQGWLESRLTLLQTCPGPAILLDEGGWGSQRLIEALEDDGRRLLWLRLSPWDEGDPIAIGNKLAEAVTAALRRPLFGYGMPYGYGLAVLESCQGWLGPLTFAVSHAEYAPKFAQGCFELHWEGTRLVLHFGVPHAEIALYVKGRGEGKAAEIAELKARDEDRPPFLLPPQLRTSILTLEVAPRALPSVAFTSL